MADEYDIVSAFEAIENELIESMIRNMKHHKAEETKEGIQWTQWQTEELKSLEKYKREMEKKYSKKFNTLNGRIEELLRVARTEGNMEQEIAILEAIKKGFPAKKISSGATAEFFKLNDRKLDALIEATTNDMEKAETAILRMANDQYRKVIYNAQVYANTGAGTYEKAVDMATRDFIAAGLNCVEYANGARHTLSDYAEMAIRTASKRAYLTGEGEKRQEWGISTVIVNKRGNPCPKCLPFCGKVFIDDVWSGGSKKDGNYPLISQAIDAGLYHPRCKDSHTTYFPGISTADDTWTKEEIEAIEQTNKQEAKKQYAKRQAEKFERLEKFSLDEDNKTQYEAKKNEWDKIADEFETTQRIKAAEETAKQLGVSVDYSKFNPDLAEAVNQSIKDVQSVFGNTPELKRVAEYTGNKDFYAAFERNSGTLFLKNVGDPDILKKMKEDAEYQFLRGGWTTNDTHHAIVHEIGHAIEKQYLTSEKYDLLEELRKAEVKRVTGDENTNIDKYIDRRDELLSEWGNLAKENLSLYGISSVKEMISESVAQNILAEPNFIAQQVIMILLE